jgi:hypothetical protein
VWRAIEPLTVQLVQNDCISGLGNPNTATRQRIEATKELIRISSMADAAENEATRKKPKA